MWGGTSQDGCVSRDVGVGRLEICWGVLVSRWRVRPHETRAGGHLKMCSRRVSRRVEPGSHKWSFFIIAIHRMNNTPMCSASAD
eukprot:6961345-Prymnesium_polylepis.1